MDDEQKRNLCRIGITSVLLIIYALLPLEGVVQFLAYLAAFFLIGYDVLFKAVRGMVRGRALDENLLMAVASVGAIVLAVYEGEGYTESVAVMLFYQIGEWFEDYAVDRSRKDITGLMDIRPDYANLEEDGRLKRVSPEQVPVGAVIVVEPGEKIPLDGIVAEGEARLDTVALTGESLPRRVQAGDAVISGCINEDGVLRIRTTKEFSQSTASRILALVEDAGSRKARAENFITRFARVYTPIVVGAAVALAFLPPLIRIFALGMPASWETWIYRALVFLVISCPCALVISIPLGFFAGIGGASRKGVLVKGANYLETLADVDTVVFDKTGTLTKGVFKVTAVHPEHIDAHELLHLAAHVERYSRHPIAASLKAAYPDEADDCDVRDVRELAGKGAEAYVNGRMVAVGNSKLMDSLGVPWHPCEKTGTIVHVAVDGKYMGHVVISDVIKEHSAAAIRALKRNGIRRTVMLTGDEHRTAEEVGRTLQLDEVYSELLPQDKVAKVEALLSEENARGKKGRLAFVGDGINDAPVLSRADVGIAMGALGSDAAIEAADIVLMDDDPLKIPVAQKIARKTLRIVRFNIVFAIGVKALVLVLGALGLAGMWAAIFADTGVLILCVLNAMRALLAGGEISESAQTKPRVKHRAEGGASTPSDAVRPSATQGQDSPDREYTYRIDVDCANCAEKMEHAANQTPGVKKATVNFMMLQMKVRFEQGRTPAEVMPRVRAACKKVDDDCEIFLPGKRQES